MNVLIVDDSQVIQDSLFNMLSLIDGVNSIKKAEDVENAILYTREFKPEVLILDIRIHGGSGIDVLKEVKKNKPSPKVIMLTNYPYSQYKKKCFDEGADYFLDKSTEFSEIGIIFKKLIDTDNGNK
ncbi:MAG: response regulator transcription factor [Thermodesulfobacteriota bacterium]